MVRTPGRIRGRARVATAVTTLILLVIGGSVLANPAVASTRYTVTATANRTTAAPGARISISGSVAPRAPGQTVSLQILSRGAWHGVATTKLGRRSKYSFSRHVTEGAVRYRVVKAAGRGHARGVSTRVTVTGVRPGFATVSSGVDHTCALKYDGSAWCWGGDNDGQLGLGPAAGQAWVRYPTRVIYNGWRLIQTGEYATCGIRTDRTLWCWGKTDVDQTLNGTPMAGPGHDPTMPTRMGTRSDWADVTVGGYGSCGVSTGFEGLCWGFGWAGPSGSGDTWDPYPVVWTNWLRIDVGWGNSAQGCGIRTDHELWCFKGNTTGYDKYPVVRDASAWASYDGGTSQACGLHTDHTLWCFNSYDTPAVRIGTRTWRSVTAGDGFACGIQTDGSVWCWGSNLADVLGSTSADVPSSADPIRIGTATDWSMVDAGDAYACGTRTNGTLWCWGTVYGPHDVIDAANDPIVHTSPVQIG